MRRGEAVSIISPILAVTYTYCKKRITVPKHRQKGIGMRIKAASFAVNARTPE